MKKLMNKKVNLFGKQFSVFVLVMVAMVTLASAALVPYLSGMVTGNFDVDSPFEVKILGSAQTFPVYSTLVTSPVTVTGVNGGETFEITIGFKNLADVAMDVKENFVISAVDPSGTVTSAFSCDDFESISWKTCTNNCADWAAVQSLDMINECTEVGRDIVIQAPNHYDAGEENVDLFELTLKENALGVYTFNAEVIPS